MADPTRIRVLECGGGVAAETAGSLFVDTGADVVRVLAASGGGDLSGESNRRRHADRGKRLLVVEFDAPDGPSTWQRLHRWADVVIHHGSDGHAIPRSMRTGSSPRRPVEIDISTYGATGPRSSYTGGELCAQASGGYVALCGAPDREPLKLHGRPFERLTGLAAFIWATAALHAGPDVPPVAVDLSVEDTVAANLEYALSLYAWMGLRKERGITYPFAYPHDLFEVADGQVEVSLGTRDAMLMFGLAVDDLGLGEVTGFDTEYLRALRHREFDGLVAPALARTTRREFFERATELRIPSGYVTTPDELAGLPPVRERAALADGRFPHSPLTEVAARRAASTEVPSAADVDALGPDRPQGRTRGSVAGDPATRPLAGVTVLDLTLFYAGPTATRILAELGAEVIRVSSVHSPGRGLGLGLMADYSPGDDPWNGSFYYYDRYAGKKEVTLDLSTDDGMQLFRQLLDASDVFVTNFSPRALEQMGLGPRTLVESFPRLIVGAISGYGATGPWANRPAVGPGIEALAGIAATTGYPGGPPMLPGTAIADAIGGYWAAAAVLQRLTERARSGAGGVADVSMLEGCMAIFPEPVLDPERYGGGRRFGNDEGAGLLAGIFPCAGDDRWIAIEIETVEHWADLVETLGLAPQLPPARDERASLVGRATRGHDAVELESCLQDRDVPAVAIRDARDLVADAHLWCRGTLEMVDHPGRGRRPMARQLPGLCAELDVGIPGREPMIGEHNDEILGGRLGTPPAELSRLEAAGVIGTRPSASWDGAEILDPALVAAAGLTKPLDDAYRRVSETADRSASAAWLPTSRA